VLEDDDRTHALYNQFDTDGSGIITEENIIESLGVMGKNISQSEIDDFITRYGENDGTGVTYENFKNFLMYG
jgi:Ca2+-binding EF-hand superfamily protein